MPSPAELLAAAEMLCRARLRPEPVMLSACWAASEHSVAHVLC